MNFARARAREAYRRAEISRELHVSYSSPRRKTIFLFGRYFTGAETESSEFGKTSLHCRRRSCFLRSTSRDARRVYMFPPPPTLPKFSLLSRVTFSISAYSRPCVSTSRFLRFLTDRSWILRANGCLECRNWATGDLVTYVNPYDRVYRCRERRRINWFIAPNIADLRNLQTCSARFSPYKL